MKIPILEMQYDKKHTLHLNRQNETEVPDAADYTSPKALANLFRMVTSVENISEERVWMLAFDETRRPIGYFELACGTKHHCQGNRGKILLQAQECHAYAIAIAHNHPGGHRNPSDEDVVFTDLLKREARDVGIYFLDHIILPRFREDGYYSFAEHMQAEEWQKEMDSVNE